MRETGAFITGLGGVAAWPMVGRAQQSGAMRRISGTLGNMRELGVSTLIASHDAFLAAGYILNEPH
jgi:hypothetical protein